MEAFKLKFNINKEADMRGKIEFAVVCLLFVLSIIRMLLQIRLPLWILPAEVVDDGLIQSAALHLSRGEYLGGMASIHYVKTSLILIY